jgi:hypothetical protein
MARRIRLPLPQQRDETRAFVTAVRAKLRGSGVRVDAEEAAFKWDRGWSVDDYATVLRRLATRAARRGDGA